VQSSLVTTDGTDETTLVAPQACRLAALASDCDWYFGYPRAGPEYLVDRGVTTWVTTTTSGVARRVGTGPSVQVFPLPAFLDEIGPGGEVLLLRRYSASGEILWSEHPHVVDPDGTVTALHAPAGSDVAFAGPHLVAWATGDLFLLEPPGGPAPRLWEQPDPTTVLLGGYLELSATFGGSPVPDIAWERSTDGSTWVPLAPHVAGQDPTWSPYTSTLFLAVTAADVPYRWYRAVAVSSEGSASTDPVSVTVRPPVIVPGAVTVTEATATAQLRVTLSDPVRVTAGARWRTVVVPGLVDQATPGVDYTAASGTISFPPGAQVAIIPVAILPDAVPEADERIIVQVGAPTNASIGGIWGLGSITITDDD
jgi:hypothetical protein